MKKTLLLLTAALISASAFSQTVTKVSADGSDNTFKLGCQVCAHNSIQFFG